MGIPITLRLKEIKKRRALRGKQSPDSYRDELLINSAGKRTVVLLNPFFYFWLYTGWLILPLAVCPPFFIMRQFRTTPK
jgi:hypothetical protein